MTAPIVTWVALTATWVVIAITWRNIHRRRRASGDLTAIVDATREDPMPPIEDMATRDVEAMAAHTHAVAAAMATVAQQLDNELAVRYTAHAGVIDAELHLRDGT